MFLFLLLLCSRQIIVDTKMRPQKNKEDEDKIFELFAHTFHTSIISSRLERLGGGNNTKNW